MNDRIRELATQAGGEFWQRIDSDGILWKEAYVTFDPPQSLEKFVELIVKEAGEYLMRPEFIGRSDLDWAMVLNEHFGVNNDHIQTHRPSPPRRTR